MRGRSTAGDDRGRPAGGERVRQVGGRNTREVRVVAVDVDRPGVVQPEAGAAVRGQLAPEVAVGGEQRVAGAALTPGERLELARLLERVDADVRVAADGHPHPRVEVPQR